LLFQTYGETGSAVININRLKDNWKRFRIFDLRFRISNCKLRIYALRYALCLSPSSINHFPSSISLPSACSVESGTKRAISHFSLFSCKLK
jgi:hypothetical protein